MSLAQSNSNIPVMLWSIAALLITGAVIAGLVQTGGPEGQRMLKMDNQRVSDLYGINAEVQAYVNRHQHLPNQLDDLTRRIENADANQTLWQLPRDPQTHQAYRYQKKGENRYALCATFQLDDRPVDSEQLARLDRYERERLHPSGSYCYHYELKKSGSGNYSAERL